MKDSEITPRSSPHNSSKGYDVIFALPYPFSDHPAFPEGILKRSLEDTGFKVGVIERPFWQKSESFEALGRPRLFFAVITGPVDSMVLTYTSSRKRRREDLYQWSGEAFFPGYPPSISYRIRPDRAAIVFSQRIREAFKDVPVIIGGIEAGMRIFAHYDFQQDRIRRSILLDSRADLAVMGPGEKQLCALAAMLRDGKLLDEIRLPGTARALSGKAHVDGAVEIPSYEEIMDRRERLLEARLAAERAFRDGKRLIQRHGDRIILAEPPMPYSREDLDKTYGLPFNRCHLQTVPNSPALNMNLFSITSHRGCLGACAFCALTIQEGRRVISRSQESVVDEVRRLTAHPLWRGYISDIGGPSAEMFGAECLRRKSAEEGCRRGSCLFPSRCERLRWGRPYLELLAACRRVPGVKKVFVGSGLRYDLLIQEPDLLEEIMAEHCGSFMRIAPEHTEDHVLRLMGKPPFEVFERFAALFETINRRLKRRIQLAPYLIVGHPGESERDVKAMKEKLRALGLSTTDVQIFTPTPGTLSTAMYWAGCDSSGRGIPVERDLKALSARRRYVSGD